jgi:type IV pilus assembly protein PilA
MNNKQGFTLIELLVVVAIIGLLAAIAVPQFAKYRGQAYCSRAETDAANAAIAMEAYYALTSSYGTLAAANFTSSSPKVSVAVAGTSPLSITATDLTGFCPKGTTYTITQGSTPIWG